MEWWEVNRYIKGLRMRERPLWMAARWHGWLVSQLLGGKSDSPEDMMSFPWEEEKTNPEEEARAMEELLAKCREANRKAEQ